MRRPSVVSVVMLAGRVTAPGDSAYGVVVDSVNVSVFE